MSVFDEAREALREMREQVSIPQPQSVPALPGVEVIHSNGFGEG